MAVTPRFVGTHTPKLDDKGRLTLPAKYRESLLGGVVIARGQDFALAVYPAEEFERLSARTDEVDRSDVEARAYVRGLFASADEQRLDAQGRITVSSAHRAYADLTKECVVIGSGKYLEIWDAARWEAYQADHEAAYSAPQSEALKSIF